MNKEELTDKVRFSDAFMELTRALEQYETNQIKLIQKEISDGDVSIPLDWNLDHVIGRQEYFLREFPKIREAYLKLEQTYIDLVKRKLPSKD